MSVLASGPNQDHLDVRGKSGTCLDSTVDERRQIEIKKLVRRYGEGNVVIEPKEMDNGLPFCTGTLRICGEGGYGIVVESTDVDDSHLSVAVKILSPDRCHEHYSVLAFERESQILARIQQNHSYLRWMPKYYGSGMLKMDSGRIPWLSMEYLDVSVCDLPPDSLHLRGARLYVQLVDALESLHSLGYVHGDVKPENFMLRRQNGQEEDVVLIDYGLAQSVEASVEQKSSWRFCGTVPFASDRQLLGRPTGPADDLESLAYSIIVMESGYVPWEKYSGFSQSSEYSESWIDQQIQCESEAWHRERMVSVLLLHGGLPAYLATWLKHCKTTPPACRPDYNLLRRLLLSRVHKRVTDHRDDAIARKKAKALRQEE